MGSALFTLIIIYDSALLIYL